MFVSKIAMKKIGHRACLSDMMSYDGPILLPFSASYACTVGKATGGDGGKFFYRKEMVCCRIHLVEKR